MDTRVKTARSSGSRSARSRPRNRECENPPLPFQAGDFGLGISAAPDDRQRELQAQGPTFGEFLQLRRNFGARGRAKARPDQLRGFVETELKGLRPDDDAFAIGDKIVNPELAIRP